MKHGRGELLAAHSLAPPPAHWEAPAGKSLRSLSSWLCHLSRQKRESGLNLAALGALLWFLVYPCCFGSSARPLLQSILDALLESHKELGNPALHSSLKVGHAHPEQH